MTLSLPDPEWDECLDAWFHRSVREFLERLRQEASLPFENGDGPELTEALADALLARRAELVYWINAKRAVADSDNGGWEIKWQAVKNAAWDVTDECRARLEAESFTTLDDWLSALHRGELSAGPEERWAGFLVQGGSAAWTEARRYRRRPCKVCGRGFRPVDHQEGPQQRRGNATRCPDCRSKAQRRPTRKERCR